MGLNSPQFRAIEQRGHDLCVKSLKNRLGGEQPSFLNVFIISDVPRLARVRCSPFVATSKLSFVEKINPQYLHEFTTSKR